MSPYTSLKSEFKSITSKYWEKIDKLCVSRDVWQLLSSINSSSIFYIDKSNTLCFSRRGISIQILQVEIPDYHILILFKDGGKLIWTRKLELKKIQEFSNKYGHIKEEAF